MEETGSFNSVGLVIVLIIIGGLRTIIRNQFPAERYLCRWCDMLGHWVVKLDNHLA